MAPPQGLKLLHSNNCREVLKKSSSKEVLHQIGQYLACSFPRTGRCNFVQMKSLGLQMAPPQGLNFDIVIYEELFKKSSQEPLGQFQPNLAGHMLGRWGNRFVQIKEGGHFWDPINA